MKVLWQRVFLCLGFAVLAHGAATAEPVVASSAPLSLDRLIALSFQHHPSISAARAGLNAAQSEVSAAQSQYYPTPSVQVLQDKGNTSTVLTVQQPLWAGGRLDAGLEAARSRMSAAEVSIEDARYNLALRVTSAWGAWVQAYGRVKALEEGVTLLNVYTASVNRRIEGGVSAKVDNALVASRLTQTEGDLAAARAAERSALGRLAQLVGRPLRGEELAVSSPALSPASGKGESGVNPFAERETTLPDRDLLIAQALTYSPALKRAAAEIEAARNEVEQKRALRWPTLNLRAQHKRSDAGATGIAATDNSLMLVLEYAPGAGWSVNANIDAAESRLQALRDNLAAARSEVIAQVQVDYEDHRANSDRVRLLVDSIEAGTEVLTSYDRLFIAGKRGWMDVINAVRDLIQTRILLADALAQQAASRARLRLHIGETP